VILQTCIQRRALESLAIVSIVLMFDVGSSLPSVQAHGYLPRAREQVLRLIQEVLAAVGASGKYLLGQTWSAGTGHNE
jgi:hypothetical protein